MINIPRRSRWNTFYHLYLEQSFFQFPIAFNNAKPSVFWYVLHQRAAIAAALRFQENTLSLMSVLSREGQWLPFTKRQGRGRRSTCRNDGRLTVDFSSFRPAHRGGLFVAPDFQENFFQFFLILGLTFYLQTVLNTQDASPPLILLLFFKLIERWPNYL